MPEAITIIVTYDTESKRYNAKVDALEIFAVKYSTVQDAIDSIKAQLRGNYTINVKCVPETF